MLVLISKDQVSRRTIKGQSLGSTHESVNSCTGAHRSQKGPPLSSLQSKGLGRGAGCESCVLKGKGGETNQVVREEKKGLDLLCSSLLCPMLTRGDFKQLTSLQACSCGCGQHEQEAKEQHLCWLLFCVW